MNWTQARQWCQKEYTDIVVMRDQKENDHLVSKLKERNLPKSDLSSRGGAQAWTYSYSISPNRRWQEAKQWCQEHSAEMVVIQNQEEIVFLNNLLPFNTKYYWIGIRKQGEDWIWDRTNEKVPEEAQNWALNEPDDGDGQDCVEIYIKRVDDTDKWNNDNCRRRKGTICYTVLMQTVWRPLGTIPAGAILVSKGRAVKRAYLNFYAKPSGHWNNPVPLCQAERCPVLNHTSISAGRLTCTDPIAPYSYNSTCEVRCDEGYEPSGQDQIRCDHTGQWTASVPSCTVQKCSPILFPVMGNMKCVDILESFSFGSRCNFTCQEGYYLTGDNTLTCLASKQWSKPTPTCTAKRCHTLNSPSHGSLLCSNPHEEFSFGSWCNITCDGGFVLNGTTDTECTSVGTWSTDMPRCLAKRCSTLSSPPHGSFVCYDPHGEFSFGSHCNVTCDEGFVLDGTADTECTSLGKWSADMPHCLAMKCPTLNSPSHGSLSCSYPHEKFSFGSRCTSTCEEGFVVNGTADTECTPLGTWSRETPHCLAVQCEAFRALPLHLSLNCSHPLGNFTFGSQCLFTCEEGFSLNGKEALSCSSTGFWSDSVPSCTAGHSAWVVSPHPPVLYDWRKEKAEKCSEGL
ncbi:E-selectin CD62 antigen-like family member E [Collichthys lucidus]|uniref:E-selectin CD62 antigen-like family member E n=1 Tax=Collichthys lucidus TaxID=240159 RepID=A0A4U5ULY0_COLLU|nr:E-selectin CD62 antigen-like family member E [Collichthys lucidus]